MKKKKFKRVIEKDYDLGFLDIIGFWAIMIFVGLFFPTVFWFLNRNIYYEEIKEEKK